jgi:hypothetical protein
MRQGEGFRKKIKVSKKPMNRKSKQPKEKGNGSTKSKSRREIKAFNPRVKRP